MMKLIAPAKINLYLHITGRRDDGYHLLDSLFIYTTFGDQIILSPAEKLLLTIDGPFQSTIEAPVENNLVYRAAHLLKKKYNVSAGAHIHLTKNIPVGAGLGGGSSDAATTLNALNTFWHLNITIDEIAVLALSLGADIPACLYQKPAFVSGIGEIVKPITAPFLQPPLLLIKPPQSLSTPAVFKQYASLKKPFSKPVESCDVSHLSVLIDKLNQVHNDLEEAAIDLMPSIKDILTLLKQQNGCLLARMSGSGSACFGVFNNDNHLLDAKMFLQNALPTYWIQETH